MTIFRKETRLKKGVIVAHIIKIKVGNGLKLINKKMPFLFSLKTNYSFHSEQL